MELFDKNNVVNPTASIDDQVAVIQNSAELFQSAPGILIANQNKAIKALAVGNDILTQIKTSGMNTDLDERANNYLANCTKALTQMKDSRAPITQIMTALAKMYTAVENQLDKDKQGTVAQQIQLERNKWVQEQHALAEKKKKEEQDKANKATEAIQIKHDMLLNFMGQFNQHLLAKKQTYLNSFNAITLENYETKKTAMAGIVPNYQFKCEGPYCKVNKYHSNAELAEFAQAVIAEAVPQVTATYNAEVTLAIQDLIDKLPSKLTELQQEKKLADEKEAARLEKIRLDALAADADKKEKARLKKLQDDLDAQQKENELQQQKLQQDKQQREQEEGQKLVQEAAEDMQQVEVDASVKKAGEETLVMFNQEAEVATVSAPAARQGYEIKVLHSAAWVQIFQLWYEQEGKNLALDKMEAVKLGSMKGALEKLAHKGGARIDSKLLEYVPTFKAVTKKNS